jgi:acyl-CoA thioester hydrolase
MSAVHEMTIEVQIFDTDCYGVMWHGSYAKWLEMGRVKLCQQLGISMDPPGKGFVFPVVEQRLKYRGKAAFGDILCFTTTVQQNGYQLRFDQTVTLAESQKPIVQAETSVVVVDPAWTVQRKLPEAIRQAIEVPVP